MSSDTSTIFADIYRSNEWTNGSGPGSIASLNLQFFEYLSEFIDKNKIKSISDVGCGDFQLLKNFSFNKCEYMGFDVVPNVVEQNNRLWANSFTKFQNMPIDLSELPFSDLYIVKDVFIHLPNIVVKNLMITILEKCKFAIVVNNYSYNADNYNQDISIGAFRPVDVCLEPFNFKVQETKLYGKSWYYDPKWPKFLAILLRKRVWPGEKHIQLMIGNK